MPDASSDATVSNVDAESESHAPEVPTTASFAAGFFDKAETLLIFDWDDTILPSTWLNQQGLRLDPDSQPTAWHQERLHEVALNAIEVFNMAKTFGTVVLVTNAERGWIELSCQKFMPALYPSLGSIPIVSARTTYETAALQNPLDWKLLAFENEIKRFYGAECLAVHEKRKNIVSLGDSFHEREALLRTTAGLPGCRPKSVKFVERPDISQIVNQHALVLSCFNQLADHDGPFDLRINCP
jgi:hypothetical protein